MIKNIDYSEVSKFSELANQWWEPLGPQAPLHIINPARLNFAVQNIPHISSAHILDVGCGAGIFSESLAKLGAKVTGIDASSELIACAKEHASLSKLTINYQHILVEDYLEQYPTKFDVITCMELLEHVPSPSNLIKNLSQLLKTNGKLVISTINRTPQAYLGAILFAEYLAKLLPVGTHDYQKFIQPNELNKFCESHGLILEKIQGIAYNPIIKQASLTNNCKINYICLITKP